MTDTDVIEKTQHWIDRMVVGLNLCPFAKHTIDHDQLRYVVCDETDANLLTQCLANELNILENHPEVETTLIIHPRVLQSFDEYLDYLAYVDELLDECGYEGVFQVAGFHPNYQFDGVVPHDPANHTNRSPFPMLHLLREASVERAIESHSDIDSVPERNIELLRQLGEQGIIKQLS